MQDDDIRWFLNNYNSLYSKYGKCFLAIKDKKVLGKYKTSLDAYKDTITKEEDGTFVVQECRNKTAPKVMPAYVNSFLIK